MQTEYILVNKKKSVLSLKFDILGVCALKQL